ncbi:MAG: UvrD-helicase domain-containing protein [Planctomycetia bacterium]|nr:UvrD-helicase domain-containing protein [Planctomycetia bacterium]
MDLLLENLSAAQREATTHREKPLLVLAGPGSGKTRVVTHRVAWLLEQGVSPQSLLVLTFTNKAAEEMKERVRALSGTTGVWISTFHRFCCRLLRQYATLVGLEPNFTIYDENDALAAVRKAILRVREAEPARFGELKYSPDSLANALSAIKNRFLHPEAEYVPERGDSRSEFLQVLLPAYQETLRLANSVDFDDLLLLTVRLLQENPELRRQLDAQFQYVLIDEYQDTNLAQYAISRLLATDVPNLMATGDPDQSIYGWRGADIRNILEFEQDYPDTKIVRLEQNYRSTPEILAQADALIRHNRFRKPKALFTENPHGPEMRIVSHASAEEEAEKIAAEIADAVRRNARTPRDFAIFYRMNALSVALEKALRLEGIPFHIVHGTGFFHRAEVRDLLAFLRLLVNPDDNEAFLRIVNVPTRGIGKTSLERLGEFAWANGCSLWEAARRAERIPTLKKRAVNALLEFVRMISTLYAQSNGSLSRQISQVLEGTGYARQFSEKMEEDSQKLANLNELVSLAARFEETSETPTLDMFLEQVSLASETDTPENTDGGVSLMTLHAAKGLEFPVVYIIAVEHGILPHDRSRENEEQLEEERRLLFVGMTRAQEELTLSWTRSRCVNGQTRTQAPGQFLLELPHPQELERVPFNDTSDDFPEDDYDDYNQETFYEEPVYRAEEPSEKSTSLPSIPGLMTAAELLKRKEGKGEMQNIKKGKCRI